MEGKACLMFLCFLAVVAVTVADEGGMPNENALANRITCTPSLNATNQWELADNKNDPDCDGCVSKNGITICAPNSMCYSCNETPEQSGNWFTGTCTWCSNNQKFDLLNDICYLKIKEGKCKEDFERWGYNLATNKCQKFIYGGCHGNDNKFETEELCRKTCRGVSSKSATLGGYYSFFIVSLIIASYAVLPFTE